MAPSLLINSKVSLETTCLSLFFVNYFKKNIVLDNFNDLLFKIAPILVGFLGGKFYSLIPF